MIQKSLLRLIKFYQKFISPFLGRKCRFVPSCSEFTKEAIIEYGVVKGGFLSILRIIRCNPLSRGGYDPVKKRSLKEREK